MMKRWLLCGILLMLASLPPQNGEGAARWTLHRADGERLTVAEAVRSLRDFDVICFGEYHDQSAVHQAEMEFLAELYRQDAELVLSMEMFERDVQPQLDRYLQGAVDETAFLETSRPWPNYRADYRPLVEFAKAHGVHVIAANVPRRLASQYAKSGALNEVAAAERQYLPRVHVAGSDRYYENFAAYMTSGQIGMKLSPEQIDRFYAAQCLKDDQMAESIADYRAAHPGKRILHVQGEFHGRAHLGVPEKLRALAPQLKIAVIAPVFDEGDMGQNLQAYQKAGDMLLLFQRNEKNKKRY